MDEGTSGNEIQSANSQLPSLQSPVVMVTSTTSGQSEKQEGGDENQAVIALPVSEDISIEEENSTVVPKRNKKPHRRGKWKKRKWKPYYKLSWKEKGELEDRQAKKATRIRAERFAHGQPVAPYNTTQFLMEDHNVQISQYIVRSGVKIEQCGAAAIGHQEPDLDLICASNGHRHHRESTSLESSDEFYSSPEDEEEFLQKEFSEVYERIHAERLHSMSKTELVSEYIQLEDRVDRLEQRLKEVELPKDENSAALEDEEEDSENARKIKIFQEEIRKLTELNAVLKEENSKLLGK